MERGENLAIEHRNRGGDTDPLQDLAGVSELPGGTMTVALVTTSLLLGLIYVLLPLAFVLFYRSPHVAAT